MLSPLAREGLSTRRLPQLADRSLHRCCYNFMVSLVCQTPFIMTPRKERQSELHAPLKTSFDVMWSALHPLKLLLRCMWRSKNSVQLLVFEMKWTLRQLSKVNRQQQGHKLSQQLDSLKRQSLIALMIYGLLNYVLTSLYEFFTLPRKLLLLMKCNVV